MTEDDVNCLDDEGVMDTFFDDREDPLENVAVEDDELEAALRTTPPAEDTLTERGLTCSPIPFGDDVDDHLASLPPSRRALSGDEGFADVDDEDEDDGEDVERGAKAAPTLETLDTSLQRQGSAPSKSRQATRISVPVQMFSFAPPGQPADLTPLGAEGSLASMSYVSLSMTLLANGWSSQSHSMIGASGSAVLRSGSASSELPAAQYTIKPMRGGMFSTNSRFSDAEKARMVTTSAASYYAGGSSTLAPAPFLLQPLDYNPSHSLSAFTDGHAEDLPVLPSSSFAGLGEEGKGEGEGEREGEGEGEGEGVRGTITSSLGSTASTVGATAIGAGESSNLRAGAGAGAGAVGAMMTRKGREGKDVYFYRGASKLPQRRVVANAGLPGPVDQPRPHALPQPDHAAGRGQGLGLGLGLGQSRRRKGERSRGTGDRTMGGLQLRITAIEQLRGEGDKATAGEGQGQGQGQGDAGRAQVPDSLERVTLHSSANNNTRLAAYYLKVPHPALESGAEPEQEGSPVGPHEGEGEGEGEAVVEPSQTETGVGNEDSFEPGEGEGEGEGEEEGERLFRHASGADDDDNHSNSSSSSCLAYSQRGTDELPYCIHRRVMGWKLTSPQRRKELVGLLDMLTEMSTASQSKGLGGLKGMGGGSTWKPRQLHLSALQQSTSTTHPSEFEADREAAMAAMALAKRQASSYAQSVERMIKARTDRPAGRFAQMQAEKARAAGHVPKGESRSKTPNNLLVQKDRAGILQAFKNSLPLLSNEPAIERASSRQGRSSGQVPGRGVGVVDEQYSVLTAGSGSVSLWPPVVGEVAWEGGAGRKGSR